MSSSGITARGIEMTFTRRGRSNTVLQSLDIEIDPGSFVTLLGPSGCGKSTLLKILGGILRPTAGDVRIGEKSAADAVRDKEIGLVLQRAALLPWKTARENAAHLRHLARGDRKEAYRAADEALELVGLSHAADRLPHELSGGMAQRVSIARALAMDPTILLMDEPFGALDALTRERMNVELNRIWARTGTTVLLVTHSVAEAVYLASRVIVMSPRPGRILEEHSVDLPAERGYAEVLETPEFHRISSRVRELLGSPGGD